VLAQPAVLPRQLGQFLALVAGHAAVTGAGGALGRPEPLPTTVSVRSKSFDLTHDVTDLPSTGGLLGGSALTDPRVPVPDRHYAAESMRATVVPSRNAVMLDIAVSTESARDPEMTGNNWHVPENGTQGRPGPLARKPDRLPGTR
jgi:hypothetical protein